MKKFLKIIRKIYFIEILTDCIYAFVFEYVSNHLINLIPITKIRYLFYKFVLRININKLAYLHMGIYIYPEIREMIIGKYTIINRNCVLDRRGGLFIGNNVNISSDVAIYTAGHKINSPDFAYYTKSVYINDYVWIGTRAMIMPGVIIGRGAMIMPVAIVTRNVEDYSIVAGIPARKIGERSKTLTYELKWRSMFL